MIVQAIPVTSIRRHSHRRLDPAFLARVQAEMANQVDLLYPLLVRPADGGYEVLDGNYRHAAAEARGWPTVPCRVLERADAAYLASIANGLRQALKPTEVVRLLLPLHLEEKQEAERRRRAGGTLPARGRAADLTAAALAESIWDWTGREFAARLRIVQKADEDPERFGRFARQMDKRGRWYHQYECLLALERELAREPERLRADGRGLGTIHPGDMLDVVPALPFAADAVICDPPFGVGKVYESDDGNGWHEPSTPEAYYEWFQPRLQAAQERLRPGGLLIFFQAYEYMVDGGYLPRWYGHLQPTLFHVCQHVDLSRHQHLAHAIEVAVIAWKPGAAKLFPAVLQGVNRLNWMVARGQPSLMARGHLAAKSQDVMERLLSLTPPGAIVLDPFCGTGATLWAAEKLGRRWVGVEQSRRYIDLAWKVRQELAERGYFLKGHQQGNATLIQP
jgi:ParB-like chromosome segregation protein Spo0J